MTKLLLFLGCVIALLAFVLVDGGFAINTLNGVTGFVLGYLLWNKTR